MSEQEKNTIELEGGTYEIIQSRLQNHKEDLVGRLGQLNKDRKEVFGAVETKLIANDRINTANTCIARDIVAFGNRCLFGYNVHFGLRTEITLEDVFSIYDYKEQRFQEQDMAFIQDPQFLIDFQNLYKYYRNTFFAKFSILDNYLYMVFQISDAIHDIKTFKWLIRDNTLVYVDNRSEHEFTYPNQHEFRWQDTNYDMHRRGQHPHVSILDKVFVETVGGDLTIKIEDNTDEGRGILEEPVEYKDQTLEDASFKFADLGNLTVLSITPYLETPRYFIYNHKVKEVQRIQSIADAAVLLPDDQGLIFPDGYYLQTGEFKRFDKSIEQVKFQQKIAAPNGEDFLYVFYEEGKGDYVLMPYNIIEQTIQTPIICNGFTILSHGELAYFKAEEDATKHHVIQLWQTPFSKTVQVETTHQDSLLYKIGNKDIVKAMAECQEIITLLSKEDSYSGLYDDISKQSTDILDSYYWIRDADTANLNLPLEALKETANAAIDEFEKVVQLKKIAKEQTKAVKDKVNELLDTIKHSSFKSIDDYVTILSNLRSAQGETISLKEIRYTDSQIIAQTSEVLSTETERISRRCVQFLLDEKALAPYKKRIEEKELAIQNLEKAIDLKGVEEEVNQISTDLEMLVDIVNNLEIEDASHSTAIIDAISYLFASINQLKAALKKKLKAVNATESKADFIAQMKLFDQSIVNFIDMATTVAKSDEYLTKLSVNLEELEGKFADYDGYIEKIHDKREEVYAAFENRKNSIIEAKNRKSQSLQSAAERILKSISKKAETLEDVSAINGYFVSDLMVSKLRKIIAQLQELEESGKAESLESNLKASREEIIRKLKDKKELYEDGDAVIKLGKYKFGVNKQPLDLNLVVKDSALYYHLSGTDFYQIVPEDLYDKTALLSEQEYLSENPEVYRSEFLAYSIYQNYGIKSLLAQDSDALFKIVQSEASSRYAEGYVKGVHDTDAFTLLKTLIQTESNLGILRYASETRAFAQLFWYGSSKEQRETKFAQMQAIAAIFSLFPDANEVSLVKEEMEAALEDYFGSWKNKPRSNKAMVDYLCEELVGEERFTFGEEAVRIHEAFTTYLKENTAQLTFEKSKDLLATAEEKLALVKQWIQAYLDKTATSVSCSLEELAVLSLYHPNKDYETNAISAKVTIDALKGSHYSFDDTGYTFDYNPFIHKLTQFTEVAIPSYTAFKEAKKELVIDKKERLRLEEFKPRVLSSFVRNKLINQVYLPLFGDNLSKQLGVVGENKRTDRMGMLLLISPPGYGKTTLMEYIADRLGLVFMKINGPAIGHEITSVDPQAANNAATRQELEKLNLALEMGNNVMLYLDDIQHCNPEFLQKFISLADGQRKIEGVFEGKTKTYDFKDKKFCVVMAGNPYTESGAQFRIPDMLANRADIYNLGDVIGDSDALFKLSLIENALTSNSLLRQMSAKVFEDIYKVIDYVEQGKQQALELEGNYSKQEIQDYVSVVEKVIRIRDVVLLCNANYVQSAAMEDAYRTEPSFKLQGSYRDMNKLVAKIVPIMNDAELQSLLLSHYESESQTLTSAAEANMLKYKELTGILQDEEQERWEAIKKAFVKNNKLKGFGNQNEMAQVLQQLMSFSDNLEGIKEVLSQGFKED